ncbi:MAG: hypothetical protein DWH99_00830 [Planctomycetota bacterium]|nr:MAG: hypothetical protein DWH99_00830 [Planctomycetota bacterium]
MSSYRYVTLMVGILAASMLASEVSAMYDPGLGRFLSRDPIGFEGESPSLYQYVQSSPTYYLDPFGLIRKLPPCKQIPKLDPKDPPVMPTYPTGLPDPIDPIRLTFWTRISIKFGIGCVWHVQSRPGAILFARSDWVYGK